ncbi:hypothetical protein EBB79_08480 [Parasedimentitalea marina]|uniref:DUF1983 domain-containing protein n=1 Tax=Parasedimentitalea marina TaxID=2483033 RepID=A0A3T0N1Q2_9RHOB|nr:hypothetical protein [Parasedimentitalea marina]AZV77927.1 hypothetical protein EBB79_08480 [Parasedimentitalea marina]
MNLFLTALALWLALTQPADAAPIAAVLASLGAAFKAALTVKALASLALRSLVKAGISMLVAKLQQRKQREPGLQTTFTTSGGTDPQGTILGHYATSGHLEYQGSHGGNFRYLCFVIAVGDLPGVSLSRVIIDGEYSDLGDTAHADFGYPLVSKNDGAGNDRGWVRFINGSHLAADPYLVDKFGLIEERPWTDNHILTGVPHAILTFDRLDRMFPNGRPDVRFELDGPALYDPRKDATAGGTGAQLWTDPTTWEPTRNLMVIGYNVFRGIALPCGSTWGGGLPAEDLPLDWWTLAMDTCDAPIGTNQRPRFEGGFEVRFEEEPADFLEELFSSANAEIYELGGYWYPLVAGSAAPTVDIDDTDILVSEPEQYKPFPGAETTFNAVTITHPSPNALWNADPLDIIIKDDWVIEDGRQRLFELRLPMVSSAEQCRQIGNSLLLDNRRFRRHRFSLPPDFFHLQPLQTIRLSNEANSYDLKTFKITEVVYDLRTLNVAVSLQETDPDDFASDPEFELPDLPQVTGSPQVPDAGVPGFAVAGIRLKDENGNDRGVAIRATWLAGLEGTTSALAFQARIVGGTDERLSASTSDISALEFNLETLANRPYEVRAKAISNERNTDWTTWLPVTTPDVRLGPDALSPEFWQAVTDDANEAAANLDNALIAARITPLESEIQRVDTQLELRDIEQRSVAQALGVINGQILWATERLSQVQSTFADAGIITDPETGLVSIYGVSAAENLINEVEIRLNAAEANINLSASQAYVDQVVTDALLDPTQIPLVAALQVQVNQVMIDLDAAEAAIALKADQVTVDGLTVSLSSAWVQIDAANAAIELKVDTAEFDGVASRLQSAEVTIETLNGPQITQTVADTRALMEAAEAGNAATLALLLQQYENREIWRQDIAYASQDMRALVTEGRVATAEIVTTLGAAIDGNTALIETETSVRSSEAAALAASISTLQVQAGEADSAIVELNRVAVDSASGTARAVHQLQLDVTATQGSISASADALLAVTSRVTATEALVDALSTYALGLNSRLEDAESGLDGQASALQQITTRVATTEGAVSSQATALTELTTTQGQHTASIAEVTSAIDGVQAEYTLRIDNNGVVSGMTLRSELDAAGVPSTEVAFVSDMFAIVGPGGGNRLAPFVVYTEDTEVDGVLLPAGVHMPNVHIGRGKVGRLQIADQIVSDGYSEDSNGIPTSGLKLDFVNGLLKAAGIVVSRQMVLAQGSFTASGTHSNGYVWNFVNTGIKVGRDDVWQASTAALVVVAAINSGGNGPSGLDPYNSFWSLNASLQPGARWFGYPNTQPNLVWQRDPANLVKPHWSSGTDQRVFMRIQLDTQGGVYLNNPTVEWTVFQVT